MQNIQPKKSWSVVSTHLKNISQIGNLPQLGVNIKKTIETTTQKGTFIFAASLLLVVIFAVGVWLPPRLA